MNTPAERYAAAKNRGKFQATESFKKGYDFPFDDFQIEACHAIESGKGVLVAAPTGAGKTIVGEFAAHLAIKTGAKCFYTTPIKALSNQKFQELTAVYGEENVGLLTGDSSINGEASIVVMTTEVLRNMIYAESQTLSSLGFVVMDEVHYLADKFRGAVWEEILIHLPERIQVISLSATVSNAEEFGEWLNTIRGETTVVVSEIRPVPLYQHVLMGNRLLDLFVDDGRVNPEILRLEKESHRNIRTSNQRNWSNSDGRSYRQKQISKPEIIEKLESQGYLPAIFFVFSRVGCDASVRACISANLKMTNSEERAEIKEVIAAKTAELPEEDYAVLDFYNWCDALERGIAAHHAGLLPMFKETIEELFQRGLIRCVFATETLALGINMPARTVVLEKLTKWNGETHAAITPGEYTQLTGRAGRRGIDIEGNAVVLWNETIDSGTAAGLASTRTYPLRSSFSPTYNMSANLISRFNRELARTSLAASFAQFQADRAVVGLTKQIGKSDKLIAQYVQESECHLGNFKNYMSYRVEIKAIEREVVAQGRNYRGNRKEFLKNSEDRITSLRKDMKSDPCHQCPEREAHARIAEKGERLQRENLGLIKRIEDRTNVIPKTFDRIISVLTELEYIKNDALTENGKILTKIYAETDLLISEILRKGILNDLPAAELVALLSTCVFENRGEKSNSPRIPKSLNEPLEKLVKTWGELTILEGNFNLSTQREPDLDFIWQSYRWASGHSLTSILRDSEVTVGDFVRVMRQLIDLLGQLLNARPEMRIVIREALKRIDRGIISYSAVTA
jgi:ATP-dependent RNA helicase HelY